MVREIVSSFPNVKNHGTHRHTHTQAQAQAQQFTEIDIWLEGGREVERARISRSATHKFNIVIAHATRTHMHA